MTVSLDGIDKEIPLTGTATLPAFADALSQLGLELPISTATAHELPDGRAIAYLNSGGTWAVGTGEDTAAAELTAAVGIINKTHH